MRILIMVMPLLVIAGLTVNAGRQIFLWLKLIWEGVNPLAYGIIFGVLVLATVAAFIASRVPDIGVPRIVFLIGHHALGVLVYLIMIVNIVSLLLLLGRLVHLIPSPMPGAVGLVSGTFSLLLIAGLTIYGAVHASNIQTSRYTVQIGQTQTKADSLRIALISDIHLGYVIEEKHLAKVVEAVNAINPDVICITGDIFDGDMTSLSNPEKLQALFREMDATYGVYACLGNHDAGASYEQMLEFLSGADIQVLMDEAIVIDERFILAGRRDSRPIGGQGDAREALKGLPETKELPVIVMDHQPENISEYGSEADLILSGHTHQGQMFPLNLITNAISDVNYGYYRASDGSPQIIVTSGAGTWGPPERV
ncbi:MAG TPA: metallophosphoesterase, partial [Candidatus Pelethocola excrementipullorum]|nr:metallophosphoesterase [Candidatus Pelethocola excrementipullorum]